MENPSYLYDHYKETFNLSKSAQSNRDRYFIISSILAITLLLFMVSPDETISTIFHYLKNSLKIETTFGLDVMQTFLWVSLYYFLIRYYQQIIYIERQYVYLGELEDKLKLSGEGKSYLDNYPAVLNLIDFTYKVIYPALFLILITFKIIIEWNLRSNIFCVLIDSILCIAIGLVIVLSFFYIRKISK